MTKDYILEYWIAAVMSALDDIEELSLFTDRNISANHINIVFGCDSSSQTMIEHLKELHKLRNKEYDRVGMAQVRTTNFIYQ
jgi:nitric oxide reductase activation protein